ncbi:MAG: C40 family peptidase, partial [Lachnospiraceae bacterium]|nr:C40 family peptidase [Lachnospiraceae bacterium]
SGGSGKGQEIANYACQFVGNPYVAGGTSLTNGADCSGFVMSVYKNFGYSLPRSSYAQSSVGKSVSYSEAQPGDIIYYGGHVAIYIGNGRIVHASTERTGIKTESATYRSIITIRRIV